MADAKRDIQRQLWLLRLKRGDQSALTEIIGHWEKPLFYFLRRLLPDEADAWDALQDVWMSLLRKANSIRDGRAFNAWLYRAARNRAIDLLRRSRRFQQPEDEDETANDLEIAVAPSFSLDEALDLHRALDRLSLAHREAVTLHFLEDFTLDEIAEITQTSLGTVKSRLHYAKRALRRLLDEGYASPAKKGGRHD